MTFSTSAAATAAATGDVYTPGGRNVPLGYLRGFLTFLVVAHHAALAYLPFPIPAAKSLNAPPYLWPAFPILDPAKWEFSGVFVALNDVFFMSLMFLISGIFAWPSLVRKGSGRFLSERLNKIGIPYVVSAAVLAPLAYYPTYLAGDGAGSFWQQWLAVPFWPAGPAWFLWVLIAFGAVAAAVYAVFPRVGETLRHLGARSPICWFISLLVASTVAYVPLAAVFSPEHWMTVGPFSVQSSRAVHYLVYFVAGMSLGAVGAADGLLSSAGRLARRWPVWVVAALVCFALSMAITMMILGSLATGGPSPALRYASFFAWTLACASVSLACLSLFLRFARRPNRLMDSFAGNAYGIYLFHYLGVTWLQYTLLGEGSMPGWAKACLVTIGATLVSWRLTAAVRRIPAVARIL